MDEIMIANQRSKEIADALNSGVIRIAQAKEVRPVCRSLGQQVANGYNPEENINE